MAQSKINQNKRSFDSLVFIPIFIFFRFWTSCWFCHNYLREKKEYFTSNLKCQNFRTRKHSSSVPPACWPVSRSIPCIRGSAQPPPPRRQTPLEADPSPGHVTCDACWEANPPVDRQTPVKTLPCPKPRLRAVINKLISLLPDRLWAQC